MKRKILITLGAAFVFVSSFAGANEKKEEELVVRTGVKTTISQCYPCHGNGLDDFQKPGLIFKHATHLVRNIACVSCHTEFPHQTNMIVKSIPQVVCFTCHGLIHGNQGSMAARDCGVCHPPDFNLRPSTHDGDWTNKPHATAASQNKQVCLPCHNRDSCEECHANNGVKPAPEDTYEFKPQIPVTSGKGITLDMSESVTPSNCVPCHGNRLDVFRNEKLIFKHTVHLKKGIACKSCHKTFPHKGGLKEHPEMTACYSCHGLLHGTQQTIASRDCRTCHPTNIVLSPLTHDPSWVKAHGEISMVDKKNCYMCHESGQCRDCHVIDMPHSADFENTHKKLYEGSATLAYTCAHCHQDKDWCESCHHKQYGYVQDMGRWMRQHFNFPSGEEGMRSCYTCHERQTCPQCHLDSTKQ